MIDVNQIRSIPKSKNDSFESSAIHLFKAHCQPSQRSFFFSFYDGGGGVEGYHKTPTDKILGVQALKMEARVTFI
ncbi:hypothetical protein DWS20_11500 [Escherichia coli]|nr:hypothetical protein [Escherichia coli]EFO1489793.1 hypothetical protein [Escherichia coli]EFO1513038.1 hypothetical protein [Escherichia coli]